ncbi:MAG: hypothetical protein KJ799_08305 [Bacteroidetes bacterium]|nr:hypothetical protein [Bacteroidota bacterium]MBU1678164.1 hypothetical protein [Bacteroidota bacterium]MBU2506712.1 hypothetical protein [Bacteroidota bacterium]
MEITLYISNDCPLCAKVQKKLKGFLKPLSWISLKIKLLDSSSPRGIGIVPALMIDSELFGYGDIDLKKLERKLF